MYTVVVMSMLEGHIQPMIRIDASVGHYIVRREITVDYFNCASKRGKLHG